MKVKFYPAMYEMVARKDVVVSFMLYLWLRSIDAEGRGAVSEDEIKSFMNRYDVKGAKRNAAVIYGKGLFWESADDDDKIYLASLDNVVFRLSNQNKRGGYPVEIELDADNLSVLHGRLFGAWVQYQKEVVGVSLSLADACYRLNASESEIERLTMRWVWPC